MIIIDFIMWLCDAVTVFGRLHEEYECDRKVVYVLVVLRYPLLLYEEK